MPLFAVYNIDDLHQQGLTFSALLVQMKEAPVAGASPATPNRTPFGNVTNTKVPFGLLFREATLLYLVLCCFIISWQQPSGDVLPSLHQAPTVCASVAYKQ